MIIKIDGVENKELGSREKLLKFLNQPASEQAKIIAAV